MGQGYYLFRYIRYIFLLETLLILGRDDTFPMEEDRVILYFGAAYNNLVVRRILSFSFLIHIPHRQIISMKHYKVFQHSEAHFLPHH